MSLDSQVKKQTFSIVLINEFIAINPGLTKTFI